MLIHLQAMRMEKEETPERKEEKEKKIKQWLDRESEDVNRYRGGYATEGGFEVEDGTALHWAAYYGNYHATELLIEKGAGGIAIQPTKVSFVDKGNDFQIKLQRISLCFEIFTAKVLMI